MDAELSPSIHTPCLDESVHLQLKQAPELPLDLTNYGRQLVHIALFYLRQILGLRHTLIAAEVAVLLVEDAEGPVLLQRVNLVLQGAHLVVGQARLDGLEERSRPLVGQLREAAVQERDVGLGDGEVGMVF